MIMLGSSQVGVIEEKKQVNEPKIIREKKLYMHVCIIMISIISIII